MVAPPLPLALTMGEPAGIAPDVTLMTWSKVRHTGPPFLLVGDPDLLASRAGVLQLEVPITVISACEEAENAFRGGLPVLPVPLGAAPEPGQPDPSLAPGVVRSIERTVELALAGAVAGIVTNPIQKETLYRAGFRYQGHTDFLAHLAERAGHAAQPVMMLSAGELRTVPLTVHVPLKQVPQAVTQDLILRQARIVARELGGLIGRDRVRIAVAGLNPHAGENGLIGTEEARIIAPAVARLREEGLDVTGPLSADSLFHEEVRGRYDVYLCMYHDQALIPVKTIGFHEGVNTTLGLPFVRTSPDHGTALGLAGKGTANPSSLLAAIGLAHRLAEARARSAQ